MIEELISKGQQLDAVHFTYEVGLVDKFPPVPLLKAFLKDAKKAAASILEDPNNTGRAAVSLSSSLCALRLHFCSVNMNYAHALCNNLFYFLFRYLTGFSHGRFLQSVSGSLDLALDTRQCANYGLCLYLLMFSMFLPTFLLRMDSDALKPH